MSQITKPTDLNKIWASSGDRATPLDSKVATGWQVEIPPRQWFNWLDNRQDRAIAHINQHGIAVWDQVTQYQAEKSYTQGPTSGVIYRCTTTHTNQNPDSTSGYWEVAFLASDTEVFTEAEADNRYAKLSENLNDLPSKSDSRNNLGVYSTSQVDDAISSATSPIRSIGVAQSWVNLTASRAVGTNYTNTTGRPIMANVVCIVQSSAVMEMVVDGVVVCAVGETATNAPRGTLSAIIPPGAVYRVNKVSGGAGTVIDNWAELR